MYLYILYSIAFYYALNSIYLHFVVCIGNDFVSHVPSARELQKNQENVDATVALETFVAQKLRNYPTHKIR